MSRYTEGGTLSNDPRAQKTRQVLKQTLIQIMSEKEFSAISVNDLTKKAEINRATFYSHYADKHDLLNSIVAETFGQMMSAYTGESLSLSDETLHAFVMSVWEYLGFFRANIGSASGQQFESLIEAEVQKQIEIIVVKWLEQEISDKTTVPTMAAAIAGAIFNSGAYWGRTQSMEGVQDIAMVIRNLIIHGLKHSRFAERDTLT